MKLFERRLIINSGKGGTGKTTVSGALALAAARKGRRVLLAGMDSRERIGELFGAGSLGPEVRELYPNLYGVILDPYNVVEEFLAPRIYFRSILKKILRSQIFTYFFDALAGTREILILGMIWRLVEGKPCLDLDFTFDNIILDAPATGHGIGLLNLPQVVADTFIGPMTRYAIGIRDMLRDPALSILNIVTLPEEMPVNEAIEMYDTLRENMNIPMGYLIINAVYPRLFWDDEEWLFRSALVEGSLRKSLNTLFGGEKSTQGLFECALSQMRRSNLGDYHIRRAREAIRLDSIEIPYLFRARSDLDVLEGVSEILDMGVMRRRAPAEGVLPR